jgi:hypothetical protein
MNMPTILNNTLQADLVTLSALPATELYETLGTRLELRSQIATNAALPYGDRFEMNRSSLETGAVLKLDTMNPTAFGKGAFESFKVDFYNTVCVRAVIRDEVVEDFIKAVNEKDALKLAATLTVVLLPVGLPSAVATIVATLLSKMFLQSTVDFSRQSAKVVCGALRQVLGIEA